MKTKKHKKNVKSKDKSPIVSARPETKRVIVPQAVLDNSRVRSRKSTSGVAVSPIRPYSSPLHPPAATPNNTPLIAQDEAISDNFAWATQNYVSSAYEEGQAFLGYSQLALLAQRSEYRRAVEIMAQELTRKWIKIESSGDDDKTQQIRELTKELDRLKVKDHFRRVAEHDGYFGRAHLYLDFGATNDREELKKPIGNGIDELSRLKVGKGSFRKLKTIEAVWCYPQRYNSTDPLSDDWYNPQSWFCMGKEIHGSRLLTFVGREVSDLLKPAYSFGGLSLIQMGKPYVDNWLRTRQSVADIVHGYSVFVLMTNLQETLQQDGQQLFARAELFTNFRDNKGLMILDKESEEFKNVSASLGSIEQLQAQSQEHQAAVFGVPLIKLFGIQPSGLNASSDGEIRTFYDTVLSIQEKFFSDNLRIVINFAQLSLWGYVDPALTFSFVPLWSLDELQEANKRKVEADTDVELIDAGVLWPEEVRKRLAADKDTPYASLDITDVPIDPANLPPPPQQGEGAPGTQPGMAGPAGPSATMGGAPEGSGDDDIDPMFPAIDPREGRLDRDHVRTIRQSRENRLPGGERSSRTRNDDAERNSRNSSNGHDRRPEDNIRRLYAEDQGPGHFEESKHPRQHGKFAKSSGGSSPDPRLNTLRQEIEQPAESLQRLNALKQQIEGSLAKNNIPQNAMPTQIAAAVKHSPELDQLKNEIFKQLSQKTQSKPDPKFTEKAKQWLSSNTTAVANAVSLHGLGLAHSAAVTAATEGVMMYLMPEHLPMHAAVHLSIHYGIHTLSEHFGLDPHKAHHVLTHAVKGLIDNRKKQLAMGHDADVVPNTDPILQSLNNLFNALRNSQTDQAQDEFHEEDHPRGQPNNPGQFVKGHGSTSKKQDVAEKQSSRATLERNSSNSEQPFINVTKGSKKTELSSAPELFISPNVDYLTFEKAKEELKGDRQHELLSASDQINNAFHKEIMDFSAIGAWADGAENSIISVMPKTSYAEAKVIAAMKGWAADQKQVLLFQPAEDGESFMATLDIVTKDIDGLHDHLLDHGVLFHTLEPIGSDIIRVHVFGGEGDHATLDALDKIAGNHGVKFKINTGRGEFLGTQKSDGTDAEQRADAREAYEQIIREAQDAEELREHDIGAIWKNVRDNWRLQIATEWNLNKVKRESWSEIDQTPEKEDVEYRKKLHDKMKSIAVDVAKRNDFDPSRIKFPLEDKFFELNGHQHSYAGSYDPETGDVNLFLNKQNPDWVGPSTAHEIMHAKHANMMRQYWKEHEQVMTDPAGEEDKKLPYYRAKFMKPDGLLNPPYDEKYPVYQIYTKLYNIDQLAKTDGVTPYSENWWKAYHDRSTWGQSNTPVVADNAINETLAEMANLKEQTGKLRGAMAWKKLYHFIEDVWKKTSPEDRVPSKS